MPQICIRIPDAQYNIIAAAARRSNKTISAYVRDLFSIEPEKKSSYLDLDRQFYVVTRLLLLSLAQSMVPDMVMENYHKIQGDAEQKFRGANDEGL